MSATIEKLTIEGFKSVRKLEDFRLHPLNILIGANGAGKSNFVGFFRLLRELIEQRLQLAVTTEGGADAYLYLGPKITQRIVAKLYFGNNGYEFALVPTADNRLVFADEVTLFNGNYGTSRRSLGSGHSEARLKERKDEAGVTAARGVPHHVFSAVSSWVVYHFHDTSPTAGVRRHGAINDNENLRQNAENLAAFLYRIRQTHPSSYNKIRDVVRLATPFFDDFKLRPATNPELIQLEWTQKDSDYFFRLPKYSIIAAFATTHDAVRRTRTWFASVRAHVVGQPIRAGFETVWISHESNHRIDTISSLIERIFSGGCRCSRAHEWTVDFSAPRVSPLVRMASGVFLRGPVAEECTGGQASKRRVSATLERNPA